MTHKTPAPILEVRTGARVVQVVATMVILVFVLLAATTESQAACGDHISIRDASGQLVPVREFLNRPWIPAPPNRGTECDGLPAAPADTVPAGMLPVNPIRDMLPAANESQTNAQSHNWLAAHTTLAAEILRTSDIFEPPRSSWMDE